MVMGLRVPIRSLLKCRDNRVLGLELHILIGLRVQGSGFTV